MYFLHQMYSVIQNLIPLYLYLGSEESLEWDDYLADTPSTTYHRADSGLVDLPYVDPEKSSSDHSDNGSTASSTTFYSVCSHYLEDKELVQLKFYSYFPKSLKNKDKRINFELNKECTKFTFCSFQTSKRDRGEAKADAEGLRIDFGISSEPQQQLEQPKKENITSLPGSLSTKESCERWLSQHFCQQQESQSRCPQSLLKLIKYYTDIAQSDGNKAPDDENSENNEIQKAEIQHNSPERSHTVETVESLKSHTYLCEKEPEIICECSSHALHNNHTCRQASCHSHVDPLSKNQSHTRPSKEQGSDDFQDSSDSDSSSYLEERNNRSNQRRDKRKLIDDIFGLCDSQESDISCECESFSKLSDLDKDEKCSSCVEKERHNEALSSRIDEGAGSQSDEPTCDIEPKAAAHSEEDSAISKTELQQKQERDDAYPKHTAETPAESESIKQADHQPDCSQVIESSKATTDERAAEFRSMLQDDIPAKEEAHESTEEQHHGESTLKQLPDGISTPVPTLFSPLTILHHSEDLDSDDFNSIAVTNQESVRNDVSNEVEAKHSELINEQIPVRNIPDGDKVSCINESTKLSLSLNEERVLNNISGQDDDSHIIKSTKLSDAASREETVKSKIQDHNTYNSIKDSTGLHRNEDEQRDTEDNSNKIRQDMDYHESQIHTENVSAEKETHDVDLSNETQVKNIYSENAQNIEAASHKDLVPDKIEPDREYENLGENKQEESSDNCKSLEHNAPTQQSSPTEDEQASNSENQSKDNYSNADLSAIKPKHYDASEGETSECDRLDSNHDLKANIPEIDPITNAVTTKITPQENNQEIASPGENKERSETMQINLPLSSETEKFTENAYSNEVGYKAQLDDIEDNEALNKEKPVRRGSNERDILSSTEPSDKIDHTKVGLAISDQVSEYLENDSKDKTTNNIFQENISESQKPNELFDNDMLEELPTNQPQDGVTAHIHEPPQVKESHTASYNSFDSVQVNEELKYSEVPGIEGQSNMVLNEVVSKHSVEDHTDVCDNHDSEHIKQLCAVSEIEYQNEYITESSYMSEKKENVVFSLTAEDTEIPFSKPQAEKEPLADSLDTKQHVDRFKTSHTDDFPENSTKTTDLDSPLLLLNDLPATEHDSRMFGSCKEDDRSNADLHPEVINTYLQQPLAEKHRNLSFDSFKSCDSEQSNDDQMNINKSLNQEKENSNDLDDIIKKRFPDLENGTEVLNCTRKGSLEEHIQQDIQPTLQLLSTTVHPSLSEDSFQSCDTGHSNDEISDMIEMPIKEKQNRNVLDEDKEPKLQDGTAILNVKDDEIVKNQKASVYISKNEGHEDEAKTNNVNIESVPSFNQSYTTQNVTSSSTPWVSELSESAMMNKNELQGEGEGLIKIATHKEENIGQFVNEHSADLIETTPNESNIGLTDVITSKENNDDNLDFEQLNNASIRENNDIGKDTEQLSSEKDNTNYEQKLSIQKLKTPQKPEEDEENECVSKQAKQDSGESVLRARDSTICKEDSAGTYAKTEPSSEIESQRITLLEENDLVYDKKIENSASEKRRHSKTDRGFKSTEQFRPYVNHTSDSKSDLLIRKQLESLVYVEQDHTISDDKDKTSRVQTIAKELGEKMEKSNMSLIQVNQTDSKSVMKQINSSKTNAWSKNTINHTGRSEDPMADGMADQDTHIIKSNNVIGEQLSSTVPNSQSTNNEDQSHKPSVANLIGHFDQEVDINRSESNQSQMVEKHINSFVSVKISHKLSGYNVTPSVKQSKTIEHEASISKVSAFDSGATEEVKDANESPNVEMASSLENQQIDSSEIKENNSKVINTTETSLHCETDGIPESMIKINDLPNDMINEKTTWPKSLKQGRHIGNISHAPPDVKTDDHFQKLDIYRSDSDQTSVTERQLNSFVSIKLDHKISDNQDTFYRDNTSKTNAIDSSDSNVKMLSSIQTGEKNDIFDQKVDINKRASSIIPLTEKQLNSFVSIKSGHKIGNYSDTASTKSSRTFEHTPCGSKASLNPNDFTNVVQNANSSVNESQKTTSEEGNQQMNHPETEEPVHGTINSTVMSQNYVQQNKVTDENSDLHEPLKQGVGQSSRAFQPSVSKNKEELNEDEKTSSSKTREFDVGIMNHNETWQNPVTFGMSYQKSEILDLPYDYSDDQCNGRESLDQQYSTEDPYKTSSELIGHFNWEVDNNIMDSHQTFLEEGPNNMSQEIDNSSGIISEDEVSRTYSDHSYVETTYYKETSEMEATNISTEQFNSATTNALEYDMMNYTDEPINQGADDHKVNNVSRYSTDKPLNSFISIKQGHMSTNSIDKLTTASSLSFVQKPDTGSTDAFGTELNDDYSSTEQVNQMTNELSCQQINFDNRKSDDSHDKSYTMTLKQLKRSEHSEERVNSDKEPTTAKTKNQYHEEEHNIENISDALTEKQLRSMASIKQHQKQTINDYSNSETEFGYESNQGFDVYPAPIELQEAKTHASNEQVQQMANAIVSQQLLLSISKVSDFDMMNKSGTHREKQSSSDVSNSMAHLKLQSPSKQEREEFQNIDMKTDTKISKILDDQINESILDQSTGKQIKGFVYATQSHEIGKNNGTSSGKTVNHVLQPDNVIKKTHSGEAFDGVKTISASLDQVQHKAYELVSEQIPSTKTDKTFDQEIDNQLSDYSFHQFKTQKRRNSIVRVKQLHSPTDDKIFLKDANCTKHINSCDRIENQGCSKDLSVNENKQESKRGRRESAQRHEGDLPGQIYQSAAELLCEHVYFKVHAYSDMNIIKSNSQMKMAPSEKAVCDNDEPTACSERNRNSEDNSRLRDGEVADFQSGQSDQSQRLHTQDTNGKQCHPHAKDGTDVDQSTRTVKDIIGLLERGKSKKMNIQNEKVSRNSPPNSKALGFWNVARKTLK